MTKTIINKRCIQCGKGFELEVSTDGANKWQAGELIQNALPELSADDRELLISGICGSCFDNMFKEE